MHWLYFPSYDIYCNFTVSYRLATCYFQKQTWQAIGPRCAQTTEAHSPSEKNENVTPHPKGWEEKRLAAFLFSSSKPSNGLTLYRVSVVNNTSLKCFVQSVCEFSHSSLFQTAHWRGCEHQQHSQELREKVLLLTGSLQNRFLSIYVSVTYPLLLCNLLSSCLFFSFTLIWVERTTFVILAL